MDIENVIDELRKMPTAAIANLLEINLTSAAAIKKGENINIPLFSVFILIEKVLKDE